MPDSPTTKGLLGVAVCGLFLQIGIAVVGSVAYFGSGNTQVGVMAEQLSEIRETVKDGLANIKTQIANIPSDHARLQQLEQTVNDMKPRVSQLEQQMYQTRVQTGLVPGALPIPPK